jgi:hypothetical protein
MEQISPVDWGPIYKETLYGRWPVEPWNTVTTLLFLFYVLYWSYKIKDSWKKQPLIAICLPVIFIGFVGGFLYHSNRDNKLWLILDWGPIAASALLCCVFYWRTIFFSWLTSLMATLLPLILIVTGLKLVLPSYLFLSLGYPLLVTSVLFPLLLSLRQKKIQDLRYLFYALVCIVAAITLRFLDKTSAMDFLPMGSHFLWHIMGALTCHFFTLYNYKNPPMLRS